MRAFVWFSGCFLNSINTDMHTCMLCMLRVYMCTFWLCVCVCVCVCAFASIHKGKELLDLVKEMSVFPTNVADLKFYTTVHEHVGEARPIGPNGECKHKYLVPSFNKVCVCVRMCVCVCMHVCICQMV